MKKLLSLITALALTASMAVLPVFAEGEGDTATDPETPTATATPAPCDPLTPLEGITKLPKSAEYTKFSTTGDITEPKVLDTYFGVYAGTYNGDVRKITVSGSNKTLNSGTKYSTCLKLSGSGVLDANDAPAMRTISVIPAESGSLFVEFLHASDATKAARTLVLYQDGAIIGTQEVEGGGQAIAKVTVQADMPVYIYSQNSGLNIYGVKLTDLDTSTPAPSPSAAPEVVPSPMPIGTTVLFDDGVGTDYNTTSEKALFGNYVVVIPKAGDSSKTKIDSSTKTIPEGGTKYFSTLKLGGKGKYTERAVEIIPAAVGTLKVPFIHSSSNTSASDAELKAYQNGEVIGTQSVAQSAANGAVLTAQVAADNPVYIYSEVEGSNIYAIILEAASSQPDATTNPDATTTPSETAQPATDKVSCTKIVATYASGALTNVTITPGEYTPAEMADYNNVNNETTKTYFWKALTGDGAMEPVNVPIPVIPPEPEAEPEWGWVAANDEAVKADAALAADSAERTTKKGYVLISGLTTLFDNVSTNKAYISGNVNGAFESDTNATTLKYEATADGVLSVKMTGLGKEQGDAVTASLREVGASVDTASVTVPANTKKDVILQGEVEAGKSYYITAKGTKARFAAAAFTAQAVSKKWAVSDASIGMAANTALIPGLTTLFANASTSNKYIAAAENGKIEKNSETNEVTVTGSALKYEPTANGTLKVTMIDLGGTNSETGEYKSVTPVIYDATEKKDVFSYTTTQEKETVDLTADVVTGHTYYVTATGTKGRFTAASFTPAADAPETTD